MTRVAIAAPSMRIRSVSERSIRRYFAVSTGIILVLTGVAKIYSGLGEEKVLEVHDPIFNLPFRNLMVLVGIVELIIAGICFFNKLPKLTAGSIVWISASFLSYRAGLWMIGWRRPCPCLGTLTDQLHLSTRTVDWAMLSLALYLFVGGLYCLIRSMLKAKLETDRL